jgi:hypothetical protein
VRFTPAGGAGESGLLGVNSGHSIDLKLLNDLVMSHPVRRKEMLYRYFTNGYMLECTFFYFIKICL